MGRAESCFPPFSGLETEGKVYFSRESRSRVLDLAGKSNGMRVRHVYWI